MKNIQQNGTSKWICCAACTHNLANLAFCTTTAQISGRLLFKIRTLLFRDSGLNRWMSEWMWSNTKAIQGFPSLCSTIFVSDHHVTMLRLCVCLSAKLGLVCQMKWLHFQHFQHLWQWQTHSHTHTETERHGKARRGLGTQFSLQLILTYSTILHDDEQFTI